MENNKTIYSSGNQTLDLNQWIVCNPFLNVYPPYGLITTPPDNFVQTPPLVPQVNHKPTQNKTTYPKANTNNSAEHLRKESNKRRNNNKAQTSCNPAQVNLAMHEQHNKPHFTDKISVDSQKDFPPISSTNGLSKVPASTLNFKHALQKPQPLPQEPTVDDEVNESITKTKKKRKRVRKKKNKEITAENFNLEESDFPDLDKTILEAAPQKPVAPPVFVEPPKQDKVNSKKNKPLTTLTIGDFRIIKTATASASNKREKKRGPIKKPTSMPNKKYRIANPLDSTAPIIRRGKESLNPKPKKPTKLKKVILMYRKEKHAIAEAKKDEAGDAPKSHEVCKTVTRYGSKMHSKKFREYCNHIITEEINDILSNLLKTLIGFQDRMFHRDPKKARMKRRLCYGLREISKYVNMKRLRLIVIAPDLEKVDTDGGLDDVVKNIIDKSRDAGIPCVFGLSRSKLAYLSYKKSRIAAVGVFNYEGAEEFVKKLLPAIEDAKNQYNQLKEIMECMDEVSIVDNSDKIKSPEASVQNNAIPQNQQTSQKLELTHSRTPSQALSEPISDIGDFYHSHLTTQDTIPHSPTSKQKLESSVISEKTDDKDAVEDSEKEVDELVDELVESILSSMSQMCVSNNKNSPVP